jgi:cell division protein FtsI/penicillin-binding protein 2
VVRFGQAGSIFKLVVYAAALEQGVIAPSTVIQDREVVYRRTDPTAEWVEATSGDSLIEPPRRAHCFPVPSIQTLTSPVQQCSICPSCATYVGSVSDDLG